MLQETSNIKLIRVFVVVVILLQVIVLNFNPHYNLKAAGEDQFYHLSKYLSKIQVISYPEDILSSTCDKFEDVSNQFKISIKSM